MFDMKEARKVSINFNPFAKGYDQQGLTDAYYRLTCDPRQALLIMESCTFEEADSLNEGEVSCDGCTSDCDNCGNKGRDMGESMVMEAVRVKAFSRTAQTMAALARSLNKQMTDKGLTVGEAIIGKPKKSGLFATVTVQFPVSDGQTITIIFHSPDGNKMLITPSDEILAFRWLLNKRDITVAVSPEGEADVSLEEVGRRVAMLVEKNMKAFATKSKDIVDQKAALTEVQGQVDAAKTDNATALQTLAENQAATTQLDTAIQAFTSQVAKVVDFNAELQARIDAARAVSAGNKGKGTGERNADWKTKPPFSEDYTGPRFKYGFRARPMSIATQPDGAILGSYKPDEKTTDTNGKETRYGTVEYPFQLTADEVSNFELLDLNGAAFDASAAEFEAKKADFADELAGRGFEPKGAGFQLESGSQTFFAQLLFESKAYQVGLRFYADSFTDKPEQKIFATATLAGLDKQTASALAWIDKRIADVKAATESARLAAVAEAEKQQAEVVPTSDPTDLAIGQALQDPMTHEAWTLPTEVVKGLDSATYDAIYATLEDNNYHTENVILEAKRGGTDQDVMDAEEIKRTADAEGNVSPLLYAWRSALERWIAGTGNQTDLDAAKAAAHATPADTNADRTEEEAAVNILNRISEGLYPTSTESSAALDEAAATLERLGLMDLYDARLNEAADALTEQMAKEVV